MAVSEATIDHARRAFFEQGALPVESVRQPVLRSWLRCADNGLPDLANVDLEPLEAVSLREVQQRNEWLMRLCRPELEMLSAEARDSGGVVLLTDGEGMILDTLGDAGFTHRAAQVALRPGVCWKEAVTGTNAIGVAIAERRGSIIHGGEHYFSGHQMLSCAATPIMDPRGAILGVVDLSGPAAVSQGHALGLVRMAVDQIEHRLFGQRFEGCRVLRFHEDAAMLGTSREGILVFREDRLVGGNRRGLSLIGRHWDDMDEIDAREIFDSAGTLSADFRPVQLRDGRALIGHWSDGEVSGIEGLSDPNAMRLADTHSSAIERALAKAGGNVSRAARSLGIHRSTVHRHLSRSAPRPD